MTLFNRHERCVGLTLFRWRRWNVEIWYCPKGYEVKPHSHNHEHIELMYLFGKTTFSRLNIDSQKSESFSPRWYHMFRRFTVLPMQTHWFKVSSLPLVFINFATFLDGYQPTSASIDFYAKS